MQNRSSSRTRYLGMTVPQLVVIACLGLVTLGVMGAAGWMILGNKLPGPAASNQLVQPDLGTPTDYPTSTLLATFTPLPPTPTFTPTTYESLIPAGWNQFNYQKVELWMPPDFVKRSSSQYLIIAENKNTDPDGFKVNLFMTKDTTTKTDLDDYIREGIMKFPSDVTFLEKRGFNVGTYVASRVEVEVVVGSTPIEEAIYFIKDGGNVWQIFGVSHYDEFRKWVPIFDQIAHTFRINP